MMFLALTYDHRLLDGREAVTFLVKVSDSIAASSPKPSLHLFPSQPIHDECSQLTHLSSLTNNQVKDYIEDPRRMLVG